MLICKISIFICCTLVKSEVYYDFNFYEIYLRRTKIYKLM